LGELGSGDLPGPVGELERVAEARFMAFCMFAKIVWRGTGDGWDWTGGGESGWSRVIESAGREINRLVMSSKK
jgi:hypothetical protein